MGHKMYVRWADSKIRCGEPALIEGLHAPTALPTAVRDTLLWREPTEATLYMCPETGVLALVNSEDEVINLGTPSQVMATQGRLVTSESAEPFTTTEPEGQDSRAVTGWLFEVLVDLPSLEHHLTVKTLGSLVRALVAAGVRMPA